MSKRKWVLVGSAIFFVLFIGDYWLREVALKAVVRDAVARAETIDIVSEYFEPEYSPATEFIIQEFTNVTFAAQSVEEKFEAAFEFIAVNHPVELPLLAFGSGSPRPYYSYTTEICGDELCPFDVTRIVEISKEHFWKFWPMPRESVYDSVRWGLIYKFDLEHWITRNRSGQIVESGLYVVDWPRNRLDVWNRQLLNGRAPYGHVNYVYRKYLPLNIERYWEELE